MQTIRQDMIASFLQENAKLGGERGFFPVPLFPLAMAFAVDGGQAFLTVDGGGLIFPCSISLKMCSIHEVIAGRCKTWYTETAIEDMERCTLSGPHCFNRFPRNKEVIAMAKFDETIVIAAPLSDVFDYVSRPEHFPKFLPITDLQFLTHMHRGLGTRLRYNLTLGGRRLLTEGDLTGLELDESVGFHSTKGVTCDWSFTFKEVEGGTQLRWEGEYEIPVGFLGKLLGKTASMERAMEAAVEDSLQKLKETLESG